MKITLEVDMNNSQDVNVLISCLHELMKKIQDSKN